MNDLTLQLLAMEARLWHDLAAADYDREVCTVLTGIAAPPHSNERVEALLGLASAILRRSHLTLVESRARCAELLLSVRSDAATRESRRRIELLFLLAWLELSALVEAGPASISRSPPLPSGVALPAGADLKEIGNPELREQARKLAAHHAGELQRWRLKQRALDEQTLLATLLSGAVTSDAEDDAVALKVLAAAMALAPAVPPELRKQLDELAG